MDTTCRRVGCFWIAVLALGGSATEAADAQDVAVFRLEARPTSTVPPASGDFPQPLPNVAAAAESAVFAGLAAASEPEGNSLTFDGGPVSFRIGGSDGPGHPVSDTSPAVLPGEPLRAEQLSGDVLKDESGKLFQIAPDPADSWWDDPFGRYAYHGSGDYGRSYWMPGSGDRMGILGIVFDSFTPPEEGKLTFDLGGTWHVVSGPKRTDLPPHLWDFTTRVGRRGRLDTRWSYEVAFRPGWFSDFEGSAREGLRFPGHGVVYYTPSDGLQLQAGLDYLDRDDIAWLPVFGAAFKPHPDFRFDAVFPRPRVAYRVSGEGWFYLAAEMGGGTWAIRRADAMNDVATYRDFRICLGWQGESANYTELGLVFGRHLEYRSGTPSYDPLNTTILRSVYCY